MNPKMKSIGCSKLASRMSALGLAIFFSFGISTEMSLGTALAQSAEPTKRMMLVAVFGPGAIALPEGKDWKPESLLIYDKGTRPVATFSKADSGLTVSFILFENEAGMPPSQQCRHDAINPILENLGKSGYAVSKRADTELTISTGDEISATSYLIDMKDKEGHHQRNLFGFSGSRTTCAEIHISGVRGTAEEEAAMNALLSDFRPDLSYQPAAVDFFGIASILFKSSPDMAAVYYKSSLDVMPHEMRYQTARRIATDQLVMSLGMSGDLKRSRAVAESAIQADPDYPINYYNLACADAEDGNAVDARKHLQLAFDRRANVLKGESMPDPTKDDSILKLKGNKEFWSFVLTLPQK